MLRITLLSSIRSHEVPAAKHGGGSISAGLPILGVKAKLRAVQVVRSQALQLNLVGSPGSSLLRRLRTAEKTLRATAPAEPFARAVAQGLALMFAQEFSGF
jgi:hypothetical protein